MTTTLKELEQIAGAGASLLGPADAGDTEIKGIDLVSSLVSEGDLFAAVPGTRAHGAQFAAQTDASAILTDAAGVDLLQAAGETRPILQVNDVREVLGGISAHLYGYPSRQMTVIGITGTSGKTTTSYLLEAGLMAAGYKVGLIGTTGTRIAGHPVKTELTTPEAPTLQALFRRMADEGVTHVVMEVSSHALSLRRVAGVEFAVAGFSNLSQDHLDFHPTMEDYFQAKALLFAAESPMSAPRAVVCVDDDWGRRMSELAADAITVATSERQPGADIVAGPPSASPSGAQTFELTVLGRGFTVRLPLPGQFNVANAALAIGLAARCGVDLERVIAGLGAVAVPGRMQRIDAGQGFVAVVDYAHKPQAIAEALASLREQVTGRVGIAFGAGGNRDHAKRALMGDNAVAGADLVIVTDDNPRDEEPAEIRSQVLAGARQRQCESRGDVEIRDVADRRAAIEELVSWARPGDAVIVAGKGHETGQLVAGVAHPFDDREELARALALNGYGTKEKGNR